MTLYPFLLLIIVLAFIFPFFSGVDYDTIHQLALLGIVVTLIWDSFAYHIREVDKNAQNR